MLSRLRIWRAKRTESASQRQTSPYIAQTPGKRWQTIVFRVKAFWLARSVISWYFSLPTKAKRTTALHARISRPIRYPVLGNHQNPLTVHPALERVVPD